MLKFIGILAVVAISVILILAALKPSTYIV